MIDANKGYSGYSMSKNAVSAYEAGEMPKSKWTKKAIIDGIKEVCEELNLRYESKFESFKKADLWGMFITWSSWHHTSKCFNETDFYAINEDAVKERFEPLTAEELEQRREDQQARLKAAKAEKNKKLREWEKLQAKKEAYRKAHGFAHNSLAALLADHPELVTGKRVSSKGNPVYKVTIGNTTKEYAVTYNQPEIVKVDLYSSLANEEG